MHPLIAEQLAVEHRKDLLAYADRARLVGQARVSRLAAALRKLRRPTRRSAATSGAVESRRSQAMPAVAVVTSGGFDEPQKCSLQA